MKRWRKLGGILFSTEAKKIEVEAICPEELQLPHDKKWTAEAIFNLLDNAVKYTPSGGKIRVEAVPQEMYTRIDVSDTGKGIRKNISRCFPAFLQRGRGGGDTRAWNRAVSYPRNHFPAGRLYQAYLLRRRRLGIFRLFIK